MTKVSMVITDETKWVSWGYCEVIGIFGFNNNVAADRYIQLFEKPAAAIANGDVPAVKGMYAPTAAPFQWDFSASPIPFSELSVGISSTQVNYTGLVNTGLDLTLEVQGNFLVGSGTTLVGDLTTAVANRLIWNEASGPKQLLRLDVVNNDLVDQYIVIQASDAALAADSTVERPTLVASSTTKSLYFGRGVSPYRNDNGTARRGCTIRLANASGNFCSKPFVFAAGTDFAIRGIYE
jgi:hypothetical protein